MPSIDGFDDALDGYYDAADQVSRYLRERAREGFAAERAEKASIDSRESAERRRERVRESFLSAIGGLPPEPDDLSVERTGRLSREGYDVALVTFESRPDFHVTANCYVPAGEGPHPAVLFLCGHVDAAKADPYNQRACIELALNGFVVLAVDPLCQGERHQFHDPETGEPRFGGAGGGVFAHCYAGQQWFYAGASLARQMVHDARCGLSYLHGRADVDGDRVGVTGTSGGGIQTAFLATVDDRVDAAAPCCSVTERSDWLRTGKRIDAEQLVHGAIPEGINCDDHLAAMAPTPVCVGAAASDEYFPIEGVREAVERTREVYDLYGAADAVELVVADETHCSVYELGDPIFEWFCEVLGDGDFRPHDPDPVEESRLRCTPEGSVVAAVENERTVTDLLRAYVETTPPVTEEGAGDDADRSADDDAADGHAHDDAGGDRADDDASDGPANATGDPAESVRRSLVERFDLDRPSADLNPRYVATDETGGLSVERVWFVTERDPEAVVAGVLVSDPSVETGAPALVCYEDGTHELPDRSGDLAALAAEHGAAFAFDPRGVGAMRNREIPIPVWQDDFYGIYGTEFKLGYDALLLGESLFGMRVFDVTRAADFLRSATDSDRVALVGEGVGAYHALYAAADDDAVASVRLRDLGPSFREMTADPDYPYDTRLTVFDALRVDVPDCLAALDARDVPVHGVDASGQ